MTKLQILQEKFRIWHDAKMHIFFHHAWSTCLIIFFMHDWSEWNCKSCNICSFCHAWSKFAFSPIMHDGKLKKTVNIAITWVFIMHDWSKRELWSCMTKNVKYCMIGHVFLWILHDFPIMYMIFCMLKYHAWLTFKYCNILSTFGCKSCNIFDLISLLFWYILMKIMHDFELIWAKIMQYS